MELEMKALCESDGIEVNTQPFVLIIFGGGGDLSQKKLLPSLYNLFKLDKLNNDSRIISYGKKNRTEVEYQDLVRDSIDKNHFGEKINIEDNFLKKFIYLQGDSEKLEGVDKINKYICNFEDIKKYQIIFYLATPPNLAKNILNLIQKLELCDQPFKKKIVMEKPFGIDTESATKLNKDLNKIFKEEEIYRIDHYLGKETVQNILFFRFGNSIFEPLWNRSFIDHVQITVAENIGIESRGNFYEKAGVLKDIIQNHMMQLIALVAMEPPTNFEADCIRDEKVKIFKSISNMTDKYMSENFVLGQYGAGKINNEEVVSYQNEKNVDNDSNTGTFFSGKFHVDNWRWAEVPFYVRAGKRLNKKLTEIVVTFKIPPLKLFGNACRDMLPNELIFSIQPEEKISLSINMKYPGMENYPHPVEMNFNYSKLDTISLTAYERLLIDCIKGDLTLFARQDGVEEMWKVLDPIVDYFNKTNFNFPNYPAGSWGPKKSELLLKKRSTEVASMRPVKIFESEISMAMGAIDIIKSELLVKKKLSIAFSGGKTPIKFFRLLAEEDINWNNINIFLVDERWVPLDNPNSNYCILNMFLLKHLTIPEKNIHPINYSPSIEKSREKYEKSLLKYFKGDIIFDLMFLGVGNDGHTASIFEEDEVNFVEDVIVTSSRRHPYRRISLGMNVINGAKRKIFLMGPEKISIIEASFLKNLPVSMVVNPEFLSYKNK